MPYSDRKTKKIKQDRGIFKSILVSFFIGLFAFITVLSIISLIIMKVSAQNEYLFVFVLVASGISAFFGAVFSCIWLSSRRLLFGMSTSATLAVIEFIILLCFNNIALSNLVYLLFPIAVCCGFFGCVIGINIKKK